MSKNRWLLPNGIDELVADQARALEALRRDLLDLFDSWGYDLVFPPIIEFTDSLLTGLGENLGMQTFKFSDHQSGKSLGLRADISPQAARIDAHSMTYQGANRLCYAGTIVRSNPGGGALNRAPVQIGAELFGIQEIEADFEIISLMLTTLTRVTDKQITLEVSHQAVRSWLQEVATNAELDFETLCTLLSEKRLPELDGYIAASDITSAVAKKLSLLPKLMGDMNSLSSARKIFAQDAAILRALEEMELLANRIGSQYPDIDLLFNLSEILGSDYHTGLLFSAYSELDNRAVRVANGGRYDQVGQAFGRSRPATGFSADLKVLAQLMDAEMSGNNVIYAPVPDSSTDASTSQSFWQKVAELREQGFRVRLGYPSESNSLSEYPLSQKLVARQGGWVLVDFN